MARFLAVSSIILAILLIIFFINPFLFIQIVLLSRSTAGLLRLISIKFGGLEINVLRVFSFSVCLIGFIYFVFRIRLRQIWEDKFIFFYFLFLMWCLFGIIYSIDKFNSLIDIFKYAFPFLFYMMVINEVNHKNKIEKCIWYIIFSSIFPIMYGFYQYFTGTGFFKEGIMRVNSTFMYPNPFSAYMCIICLTAIYQFEKSKSVAQKIFLTVLFILSVITIVLTETRSALIMLFIGIPIYALLRKKLSYIMVGIPLIAIMLITHPQIVNRFIEPLKNYMTTHKIKKQNPFITSEYLDVAYRDTFKGRVKYWKAVFKVYLDKPIIGYGIGTSRKAIASYYHLYKVNLPHNDYLRILLETGLIGFILVILAFIFLIKQIFSLYIKNPQQPLYALSLSIVLSLLIGLIANNWLTSVSVLCYFITYIALTFSKREELK